MPPTAAEVNKALDVLSQVDANFFRDDERARQRALVKSRELANRLELPVEALQREIYMQPAASVAIKFAQDVGLFENLPLNGTGRPLQELAQSTNTNPDLLDRFLPLLCSIHLVQRTANNEYRGSEKSKAFTSPGAVGGMIHLFTQVSPCFSGLPDFLKNTSYRNPTNVANGPWQHALQTPDAFFDWLQKRPAEAEGFHSFMATLHTSSPDNWTNVFPVSTLANDAPSDPSTPLVVDVGGGIGADMLNLRNALLPRKFLLEVQDVEKAVEQARRQQQDTDIAFRVHDFFEPQPVIGAKAYFLHSILHDWPDPLALKILQNIRPAMKPGYSKLLLCEGMNTPDKRYHMVNVMDIVMMGLLCSKERTEAEWAKLLRDGGFVLRKVWHDPSRGRKVMVIEADPIEALKL